MNCPNCGRELRPNAKFCPGCGQPVKKPAPSPQPSAWSPPMPQPSAQAWMPPKTAQQPISSWAPPKKTRSRRRLLLVGCGAVLTLAVLGIAGWFLAQRLLGSGQEYIVYALTDGYQYQHKALRVVRPNGDDDRLLVKANDESYIELTYEHPEFGWTALAPDGGHLYYTLVDAEGYKRLCLVELKSGTPITLTTAGRIDDYVSPPQFSPNSRHLAYTYHQEYDNPPVLYVCAVSNMEKQTEIVQASILDYFADGRLLYADNSGDDDWLQLYKADGDGSRAQLLTTVSSYDFRAAFAAPHGDRIAWSSEALYLAQSDGSQQQEIDRFVENGWGFFSPDGQMLLVYNYDDKPQGDLYVYHISDGRRVSLADDEFFDFTDSAIFSSDSTQVVFHYGHDQGPQTLSVAPTAGGAPIKLDSGADGYYYDFTPDGDHVVFIAGEHNSTLFAVSSQGGAPFRLDGNVERFTISPDSERIAYTALNAANDRYALYTVALDGSDRQRVIEQEQPIEVLYWVE